MEGVPEGGSSVSSWVVSSPPEKAMSITMVRRTIPATTINKGLTKFGKFADSTEDLTGGAGALE